ncbi:MAG: tail fiber domain-containing protein, partial [Candidatus Aenigmatarchaeota archaeon]
SISGSSVTYATGGGGGNQENTCTNAGDGGSTGCNGVVIIRYLTKVDALVVLDSTGYVGIGTASPTYQLQLSTDSAAKPSTNTWTIASDERIKTDIRNFTDSLSVIEQINPVWYRYNGKAGFAADGKDQIGVIGQEIKDVAPYTVNTYKAKLNVNDTNETELLNFNSHALTFVLINAVKEQQSQISQLKSDNDALKSIVCKDHPAAGFCGK